MPSTRRFPGRAPGRPRVLPVLCALLMALIFSIPAATCRAADPGRKDNVFGTTREGMDMGRDPATGDVFMRVSPPEPTPDRQQPMPDVRPEIRPEIRPELTVPPRSQEPGPQ